MIQDEIKLENKKIREKAKMKKKKEHFEKVKEQLQEKRAKEKDLHDIMRSDIFEDTFLD